MTQVSRRSQDGGEDHWWPDSGPARALRVLFALAALIGGASVTAVTVVLGHCSVFGGACPPDPQPWWENDVLGGVAAGVGVAVLGPWIAVRPRLRTLWVAVPGAVAIGLLAAAALLAQPGY